MIEATVKLPTVPRVEFPLLAQHVDNEFIVLFTNLTTGVVVQTDGSHHDPEQIGVEDDTWIEVTNSAVWNILPPGTEVKLIQG